MSGPTNKIERLDLNPFLDGPAQYVAKTVAAKIAEIPQFMQIFGDFIDPYKRMDYGVTNLPALRIFDEGFEKEFESWFINGELTIDVIWPADLRRQETMDYQNAVATALLQQFRSITFFNSVENAGDEEGQQALGYNLLGVPGLNELGKRFSVDKSLGFAVSEEESVPLTRIRVNFRVDLRVWDQYLEDQLRTKDDPFEQTLAELTDIAGEIEAYRNVGDEEPDVVIDLEQSESED